MPRHHLTSKLEQETKTSQGRQGGAPLSWSNGGATDEPVKATSALSPRSMTPPLVTAGFSLSIRLAIESPLISAARGIDWPLLHTPEHCFDPLGDRSEENQCQGVPTANLARCPCTSIRGQRANWPTQSGFPIAKRKRRRGAPKEADKSPDVSRLMRFLRCAIR